MFMIKNKNMKIQPVKINTIIPKKSQNTSSKDKTNLKDKLILAGLIGVPAGMAYLSCKVSKKINNDKSFYA